MSFKSKRLSGGANTGYSLTEHINNNNPHSMYVTRQEFLTGNASNTVSANVTRRNVFDIWESMSTEVPTGAKPLWTGEWIENCETEHNKFWEEALRLELSGQIKVVSDAEYNNSLSTYGGCGGFIIDQVNKRIRLPKIYKYKGIIDSNSDIGDYKAQGLPNITGAITTNSQTDYSAFGEAVLASQTGALGVITRSQQVISGSTTRVTSIAGLTFSASDSNSIYGNSSNVDISRVCVALFIQVDEEEASQQYMRVSLSNITSLMGKYTKTSDSGITGYESVYIKKELGVLETTNCMNTYGFGSVDRFLNKKIYFAIDETADATSPYGRNIDIFIQSALETPTKVTLTQQMNIETSTSKITTSEVVITLDGTHTTFTLDIVDSSDIDTHENDPNAHITYYIRKSDISTSVTSDDTTKVAALSSIKFLNDSLNTQMSAHKYKYKQTDISTDHLDDENKELYARRTHTHTLTSLGAAPADHTHTVTDTTTIIKKDNVGDPDRDLDTITTAGSYYIPSTESVDNAPTVNNAFMMVKKSTDASNIDTVTQDFIDITTFVSYKRKATSTLVEQVNPVPEKITFTVSQIQSILSTTFSECTIPTGMAVGTESAYVADEVGVVEPFYNLLGMTSPEILVGKNVYLGMSPVVEDNGNYTRILSLYTREGTSDVVLVDMTDQMTIVTDAATLAFETEYTTSSNDTSTFAITEATTETVYVKQYTWDASWTNVLSTKVDKETGKSLISDTEISRLADVKAITLDTTLASVMELVTDGTGLKLQLKGGTTGDVLTKDANGNLVWQAPA